MLILTLQHGKARRVSETCCKVLSLSSDVSVPAKIAPNVRAGRIRSSLVARIIQVQQSTFVKYAAQLIPDISRLSICTKLRHFEPFSRLPATKDRNMGDNSEFHEQSADTFFMVGDPDEFDPKKWITVSQPTQRQTETHLEVLIVGAGYAGLMATLECWRMGHNVIGILDRNQGPNFSGDLIIIQPSALEVFRHWPEMRRELEEDKCEAGTYYYRHNGELIDGPSQPNFNAPEFVAERAAKPGGFPYCGAVQIRKKFYRMLLRQVARLGFKVDYGQRVERYFEDDTAGRAGVVLKDGSIRTAHVGMGPRFIQWQTSQEF